jgi:hypothetical protein
MKDYKRMWLIPAPIMRAWGSGLEGFVRDAMSMEAALCPQLPTRGTYLSIPYKSRLLIVNCVLSQSPKSEVL